MTGAVILLHPAMSGQEAHAWCSRHESELQVQHRQGKVHLIVIAMPLKPDVLDQLEGAVREQL